MGKLGKKARKFAKKNLQSVMKRKRKLKSMFNKKAPKKDGKVEVEEPEGDRMEISDGRSLEIDNVSDGTIDGIFAEDDSDMDEDDSGSDGYLSEDSSCTLTLDTESGSHLEDNNGDDALSKQHREIYLELSKKMKKLDRLKEKDPQFSKFLEINRKRLIALQDEEDYSDEDEASDDGMESGHENDASFEIGKLLSSSAVDMFYQLVTEHHNVPALVRLVNGYRAACHYGTESSGLLDKSEVFSRVVMIMLRESDNLFQTILGISSLNVRKEAILELKNTAKWKTMKPLIKSYLRSTLNLLKEVSDSEILAYAIKHLRSSIIYFVAFPPLLRRLIKISVHLWATGKGTLSLQSFLIIQDLASVFNSECFELCLIKAYKAFISHSKFAEPVLIKHKLFLKNSLVVLCTQDVHRSFSKAVISVQQLAKILQLGLRTKKKEAVKLICSWQYINCIDLWVAFISVNIRNFEEFQPLLYIIIQVINGVANLFPGPRYLPLRVKCIQWLNQLSSSSGVFIPIASFTLDILEYKVGKEGRKPGKEFDFSSSIKLPKHWLKSRKFQEECVFSVIELLATHFAQWSFYISFPELATIPLIRLRKFNEMTTNESFRRVVKRFIDQVEQNIEFVRKKRDEVAFSPKDQQSVESFLQLEKSDSNAPYTLYYRSIMEKAASRNMLMNEKISSLEQKLKGKRRKLLNNAVNVRVNGEVTD